jgi:hypothetical protein
VLRFLAEDVGKRLDEILDVVIRALFQRTRKPPVSALPYRFKIL